jgi:hypothetical protein
LCLVIGGEQQGVALDDLLEVIGLLAEEFKTLLGDLQRVRH